jgi:peptidyl-prolyl cis-trans isomerase SurA
MINKILKQLACFSLILTLTCIMTNGFAAIPKTSVIPLDRIVAVVNNDIITQMQLDQQFNVAKNQLQSENAPLPSDAQLKKQVLQQLIDHTLQLQAAHRAGLDVNIIEADKAIAVIAKRNHLTLDQLRQALAQQGMSYDTYRKQIRDQVLISKLQQGAFGSSINITQQDINNFTKSGQNTNQAANQYHLRDILVPIPATPSPAQVDATRAKANELIKQLRAGADFEKTAIAQSGDTQALNGGDLGWRHLAELPPLFAQQVVNMKTGEIAGPIRAPNGFHILKLVEVKINAQKLSQAQIRELIFERKMQEKVQAWLQKLRQDAYIKIMS